MHPVVLSGATQSNEENGSEGETWQTEALVLAGLAQEGDKLWSVRLSLY